MEKYEVHVASALEKISPNWQPRQNQVPLTVLKNDTASFQIAVKSSHWTFEWADIKIGSSIKDCVTVREVKLVPASWPYAGMYPDRLEMLSEEAKNTDGCFKIIPNQFRSLWVDVEPTEEVKAGEYLVPIEIKNRDGELVDEVGLIVRVIDAVLPKGEVFHTEWFHADCLADYYKVPVFSEQHWQLVENFVRVAVRRGMNTILTPLFTYPLDTEIGGSRTTIQLVHVSCENERYGFDFSLLHRWIDLCLDCGMTHFEMSHLYSQWGAKYAPKIMVHEDGALIEKFGWHTLGTDAAYQDFLAQFLPALNETLVACGVNNQTFIHVSDEPSMADLDQYKKARHIVEACLPDYPIIDALTDFEFYQQGVVTNPIPSNDKIEPFLKADVPNLWTYYCTAQRGPESNRFLHLPSVQTRIIGAQIFKYNLAGFLHWGYNFYNSHHSLKHINPYEVTDADGVFDAGDPFLVYPRADGYPEESIRLMLMDMAFKDIRAFTLLSQLTTKENAVKMVDKWLKNPTMTDYVHDVEGMLQLRYEINCAIAELVEGGESDAE